MQKAFGGRFNLYPHSDTEDISEQIQAEALAESLMNGGDDAPLLTDEQFTKL